MGYSVRSRRSRSATPVRPGRPRRPTSRRDRRGQVAAVVVVLLGGRARVAARVGEGRSADSKAHESGDGRVADALRMGSLCRRTDAAGVARRDAAQPEMPAGGSTLSLRHPAAIPAESGRGAVRLGQRWAHPPHAHLPAPCAARRAPARRSRPPPLPRPRPPDGGARAGNGRLSVSPSWHRGSLRAGAEAPASGERFQAILDRGGLLIEQILSGQNDEPSTYVQDHDEWVAVLAGGATLDIEGERVEVTAGDWLFLAAGVRHDVVHTEQGTSWLAVHFPAG